MTTRWVAAAATVRGDRRANQDQVLLVDGAAAVLDGATSWLRDPADPRDGGWYAQQLGAVLAAELPAHHRPLRSVLSDAIARLRDTYGLQPGESPYSTATIARWDDDRVEVLVLGDTPAAVLEPSGAVRLVADDRLAATASSERAAYAAHLRSGRGFDDDFAQLIAAVQVAERDHFNREDGFWVAETAPAAADHALVATWRAHDVAAVAILSDGAAAGVTEYLLADWADLVRGAIDGGPAAWLRRLHAVERDDPAGVRWPRTKQHDDKSLVVVSAVPD